MDSTLNGRVARSEWFPRLGVAFCVAVLGLVAGCPDVGLPTGDQVSDDTETGRPLETGEVSGEIINFTTSFGVSAMAPPISVLYTVTAAPDSISGFYIPVADASAGASPIGNRVIVATNLPKVAKGSFSFDPAAAGVGFYRVGIIMKTGSTELVAESRGIIRVQGSPNPFFIQPSEPITVRQGAEVTISFDAGDPEGDVQWRLFYLYLSDLSEEGDCEADSPGNPPSPGQLGTEVAVGKGNFGSATLSTARLAPGCYELGISATDSGLSIADTVASGDVKRIVTIPSEAQRGPIVGVLEAPEGVVPTLTFTAPGATNVKLFRNEAFTIRFTATVYEPGASGEIELFYDDDNNVSNGFRAAIVDDLPASRTSYPLPTNLPENTDGWFIGATVRTVGGISAPVTVYARGRIIVIRDPTLQITKPDSPLPVMPSTPVAIAWTTNTPTASGKVDVFAAEVTRGDTISILADVPVTTTSAEFSSDTPGLFEITVRLKFIDNTIKEVIAPERVRVSSLPRVLWLGSLVEEDPPFEGAIFGGVNFEDNAGTSFATAGDLDGDGLDDFVIGARYGKPFFVNPSGIGPGEAYAIYGGAGARKLLGEYNLNSAGTTTLRGVTLIGILTHGSTDNTDGLSDITFIPDADGDGKGELAFGFPRTDSRAAPVGPLAAAHQFLNGGVVILSSSNTILESPTSGTPVISLEGVGQSFSDISVASADADLILEDRWRFEPGNPNATPPTVNACVEGTDGIDDTIVGPCDGFNPILAPPAFEQIGFEWIYSPPAPAQGLCETQIDLSACPEGQGPFSGFPGSGFYPIDATPREPRGTRIIGPARGDRFGTSITVSNSLGDESSGDLIISAPNRTASPAHINGISTDIAGAGVAFLTDNSYLAGQDNLLPGGGIAPAPHQCIIGFT